MESSLCMHYYYLNLLVCGFEALDRGIVESVFNFGYVFPCYELVVFLFGKLVWSLWNTLLVGFMWTCDLSKVFTIVSVTETGVSDGTDTSIVSIASACVSSSTENSKSGSCTTADAIADAIVCSVIVSAYS